MTLLAAAVIVHDRRTDRVVLLRRGPGAKYGQGMWDLPVGKCEPGEPVTAAAVRELREETGLVVRAEALRVAHLVHGAWGAEAPDGYLCVVYAAAEWSGEPVNREPEKHTEVCWRDGREVRALPGGCVPSAAGALAAYFTGGGPAVALYGWDGQDGRDGEATAAGRRFRTDG